MVVPFERRGFEDLGDRTDRSFSALPYLSVLAGAAVGYLIGRSADAARKYRPILPTIKVDRYHGPELLEMDLYVPSPR